LISKIPGLIDIHTHGGRGITFGENLSTLEGDLRQYSAWAPANGVTGFVASIAAPDAPKLLALVEAYADILEKGLPGAECLGLHLEGPYLSPEKRGAFNASWLRNPFLDEAEALIRAGRGWIRQVTMAPELEGAGEAARCFRRAGIVVALGHTNANYDQASGALAGDFGHTTHTFNAMSGFDHRSPGAVGAVLNSKSATAEVIADGIHVHPGALKLLFRCLGPDRLALITDAMAGAGMPDGMYELVGAPVMVKNGRAFRPEDGKLAGSAATLNQCVANMITLAGATFSEAVRMASATPARILGLDSRLGSLEAGKDGSYAIVDSDLQVYRTVVKGRIVFESPTAQGRLS